MSDLPRRRRRSEILSAVTTWRYSVSLVTTSGRCFGRAKRAAGEHSPGEVDQAEGDEHGLGEPEHDEADEEDGDDRAAVTVDSM